MSTEAPIRPAGPRPRRARVGPRAVAFLLMAAVGPAPARAQEDGGVARLTGRVVDEATGSPIAGAEVVVSSPAVTRSYPGGLGALTDQDGRFAIDVLPPGTHTLQVRMLGYRTLEEAVELSSGTWAELDVRLAAEALELEPMMVVVRRRLPAELQGFYERREHRPGGDFITRDEIEAAHSRQLTDVLRRVPGLRIVPERRWGGSVSYQVLMRDHCRPALFIDGAPAFNTLLNESLLPGDIEAIEIYRGPETPLRFVQNGCGALVIWTRTGDEGARPGPGGVRRRAVMAGGLVVLLGLLFGL